MTTDLAKSKFGGSCPCCQILSSKNTTNSCEPAGNPVQSVRAREKIRALFEDLLTTYRSPLIIPTPPFDIHCPSFTSMTSVGELEPCSASLGWLQAHIM